MGGDPGTDQGFELTFDTLAKLLEMSAGLQNELGLGDMAPVERDIMVIIGSICQREGREVRTEEIATHPLLAQVPKSTLHRSLRQLRERGLIHHPAGYKAGRFLLSDRSQAPQSA